MDWAIEAAVKALMARITEDFMLIILIFEEVYFLDYYYRIERIDLLKRFW
jgi:hypothetical protein